MLSAPADTGYDMAVVDLAEEAKAKATDRLKTPQEAAADEIDRLNKLEQERIDRCVGQAVDTESTWCWCFYSVSTSY